MKILFNILFFVTLASTSLAQQVKAFTFHGQLFELNLADSTEKPLMGIPIEVWHEDELLTTLKSGPKGKYKISIAQYPSFRIKFGNAPYVAKVIDINAKGFERAAEFGQVNLELDVSIFKEGNLMGLDFMTYTPVAIAQLNKKKGKIEWDFEYTETMNKRVQGVIDANKYPVTRSDK